MASTKGERPQNRNLIEIQTRPPEEARAIRSAGGKASAEARKERKRIAELLDKICSLPVQDKRVINRLKRMGLTDDDMFNSILIADAIFKGCKEGNTYMISLALDMLGENGTVTKENNILEALKEQTKGDINTNDIPEIQQEANSGNDMVEPPSV